MDATAARGDGACDDAPAAKRLRAEGGASAPATQAPEATDPRTIVVLNLDGLASRMLPKKDETEEYQRAAAEAHAAALVTHLCSVAGAPPDVICLTEIHFKARSAAQQSKLESLTAALAADRDAAAKAHNAANTLLSAPELQGYVSLWTLHAASRGQAGVCVLLHPRLRFVSTRFSLDLAAAPEVHHPEGRVVLLEFATCRLLACYSPNSGDNAVSKARRAAFDHQLRLFVAAPQPKPLIWCGDLNVAPDSALDVAPSASDFPRGFPGMQPEEQDRFRGILAAGALRDAWRQLHPGVQGGMTWRGGAWKPGLSMRLDHFVVAEALLGRVEACEAVQPPVEPSLRRSAVTRGRRNTHENHYFGSDHWPLWLRLRPAGAQDPAAVVAA